MDVATTDTAPTTPAPAKTFRILIGKTAVDTRVYVDDLDITRLIGGIVIDMESDPRGLTRVRFTAAHLRCVGELCAALDKDQIEVVHQPVRFVGDQGERAQSVVGSPVAADAAS